MWRSLTYFLRRQQTCTTNKYPEIVTYIKSSGNLRTAYFVRVELLSINFQDTIAMSHQLVYGILP